MCHVSHLFDTEHVDIVQLLFDTSGGTDRSDEFPLDSTETGEDDGRMATSARHDLTRDRRASATVSRSTASASTTHARLIIAHDEADARTGSIGRKAVLTVAYRPICLSRHEHCRSEQRWPRIHPIQNNPVRTKPNHRRSHCSSPSSPFADHLSLLLSDSLALISNYPITSASHRSSRNQERRLSQQAHQQTRRTPFCHPHHPRSTVSKVRRFSIPVKYTDLPTWPARPTRRNQILFSRHRNRLNIGRRSTMIRTPQWKSL